nr:selenophosphate-dependent tRNA 2-selenouridine synthase [uncultured bacterium]
MNWLITAGGECSFEALEALVAGAGGALDPSRPAVPMGEGEVVVAATGPRDLPARLRGAPGVRGVHPNSELTLY